MKLWLALSALCALLSGIAYAQADAHPPAFEVASLKRNTEPGRDSNNLSGDRLTLRYYPMRGLVAVAYRVPPDRVTGPGWIDTESYDLAAKVPAGATREMIFDMLRTLLIDRVGLVAHVEKVPTTVYALTVGKEKPTLAESPADEPEKETCVFDSGKMTCKCQHFTIGSLAHRLVSWQSRGWFELPVVDMTDLKGAYNFTLSWTPTDRGAAPGPEAGPSAVFLFDALRDQLGLKLERRKTEIEKLVIDHVEREPKEN